MDRRALSCSLVFNRYFPDDTRERLLENCIGQRSRIPRLFGNYCPPVGPHVNGICRLDDSICGWPRQLVFVGPKAQEGHSVPPDRRGTRKRSPFSASTSRSNASFSLDDSIAPDRPGVRSECQAPDLRDGAQARRVGVVVVFRHCGAGAARLGGDRVAKENGKKGPANWRWPAKSTP